MNQINKLAAIITHDKGLMGLLSGIIFCVIGLISVAVTAFVWYL